MLAQNSPQHTSQHQQEGLKEQIHHWIICLSVQNETKCEKNACSDFLFFCSEKFIFLFFHPSKWGEKILFLRHIPLSAEQKYSPPSGIVLLYVLACYEGRGRGPALQIETTVAALPNFESDRLNIKWPIIHWASVRTQHQRHRAGDKYNRGTDEQRETRDRDRLIQRDSHK